MWAQGLRPKSSANCWDISSSTPYEVFIICFSCLITLVKTSNTMLSKSGDSGHLYLASDFRGNVLNPVPLCIVLPIVLLYAACIMLRLVLSIASFFWVKKQRWRQFAAYTAWGRVRCEARRQEAILVLSLESLPTFKVIMGLRYFWGSDPVNYRGESTSSALKSL